MFILQAQIVEANKDSVITFEGSLELGVTSEYNFDLEDDIENVYSIEPVVELKIEYEKNEDLQMGFSLEYGREMENDDREEKRRQYSSSLTINEAFLQLSNLPQAGTPFEDIILTLGRIELDDSREWFLDAGVDGFFIEAQSSSGRTDLLFSFNREEWVGSDLLRSNDTDTVSNLIFALEHRPLKNLDFNAYAIVRSDSSSDNDSPRFIGLSAHGELFDEQLNFWSYFAAVGGKIEEGEDEKQISGRGFDIGATLRLVGSGGPYVTLAYAFGSGDGDEDTDFRQTGLQGNSDRYGGVTNFKYYGELVQPELSNLRILTAGLGVRPQDNVSVDLVYHHYQQDVALDELRDSDLNTDPGGEDADIGSELDLIAGFAIGDIDTEIVFGYFWPGDAFDDAEISAAYIVNATVSLDF